MIKAIFYEGDYDRKIVEKILEGITSPPMPIRANSKYGMKAFIKGYLEGKKAQKLKDSDVIAFRDRDFDFPVPSEVKLIIPNDLSGHPDKKIRVGYRTTIENYLLNHVAFFAYCQTTPDCQQLFCSEAATKTAFHNAARKILAYQAARHALGAMRVVADQETKLTSDSGKLPEDLSQDSCREACERLINEYSAKLKDYTVKEFNNHYEQFFLKFEKPDFTQQALYEIYFHGKDLQAALAMDLPNTFSFKTFYQASLKNFDYTQFTDLVELRGECLKQAE